MSPEISMREGRRRSRPILAFASSIRLYVYLTVLLLIALVLGTVIPQHVRPDESLPGITEEAYVSLQRLGLTDVYHSTWFMVLLFLLVFNVICCTASRFIRGSRRWGSLLTHLGIVLVLVGGAVSLQVAERGMIGLREGESASAFEGDRMYKLGFRLRLDEVLTVRETVQHDYLVALPVDRDIGWRYPVEPGQEYGVEGYGYRMKILRQFPDLRADIRTKEWLNFPDESANPAIEVEVSGVATTTVMWLFARYPRMNINGIIDGVLEFEYEHGRMEERVTAVESRVSIMDGEGVVQSQTIRVNEPLRYRGYTFYQSDFDPKDLSWTGLQVAKDPGVPLVYAGFGIFLGGLLSVFYIEPYMKRRKREIHGRPDS